MDKLITFIHIGMARDGAERVIAKLANYYGECGYKVDIIVLLLDSVQYELNSNVSVVSFVRNNKSRSQNLMYWISNIRKYVKEKSPEHIISFSMYVNLITIIACTGIKSDILISERNDPTSDGRSNLIRNLTYLLYRKANKIVFQTKRAQNSFPISIRTKSRIIYNPVSVNCLADRSSRYRIVNVGRLEPQKNQLLLLEAFRIIHDQCKQAYLDIYGEGSLRDELQKVIKKSGLENSVSLKGNVANLHERIKDASVFVLSSDFEGLSNALLEAMTMGIPCVSTTCAGSDEIIENEANGLLVPLRNPEKLASAVLRILRDSDLSDSISMCAKERSKVFEQESVIRQWIEYIES